MGRDIVTFKNNPERLLIVLDDKSDFAEIIRNISDKIEKNHDFFKGASLRLKYKGRNLDHAEEKRIAAIFVGVGEVNILGINKEIDIPKHESGNKFKGLGYGLFGNLLPSSDSVPAICEGATSYYRGNLLNGQKIIYNGSVIIIGNVEKGSSVIAEENVIVFGTVKGEVHAGSRDLKTSVIICEKFEPTDSSIAGIKMIAEDYSHRLQKLEKSGFFRKKRVNMKIFSLSDGHITIDILADL